MSSFTKCPNLIVMPPKYATYRVPEQFEYHVGSEGSGEIICVPKGFITDGASIPKFAWSLIGGPMGRYAPAAVVHDFLYFKFYYRRRIADEIFYEAMGVLGVPLWKRQAMFWAVRCFGFIPWNNHRRRNVGKTA